MKILFWLFAAVDTAALGLFFVLGMAAGTSTKQGPLTLMFAPVFLVPALLLALSIVLFTRGTSPMLRVIALLMAAAPVLILVVSKGVTTVQLKQNMNEQGEVVSYREGPLRDMADAIRRNDSTAVATLAKSVDVNTKGFSNTTFLAIALRQLEQTPTQLGVLRALLEAGANPNLVAGGELPLEIAMQQSEHSGAEPTELLLKAGADPNTKDQFGSPAFFDGVGITMPVAVIAALLDHGADVKLMDKDGKTVLIMAATTGHWKAAQLLLERGVDYKSGRSLSGETFEDMVRTATTRTWGDPAGAAAVAEYLKRK